jgi:hypothetical protein
MESISLVLLYMLLLLAVLLLLMLMPAVLAVLVGVGAAAAAVAGVATDVVLAAMLLYRHDSPVVSMTLDYECKSNLSSSCCFFSRR